MVVAAPRNEIVSRAQAAQHAHRHSTHVMMTSLVGVEVVPDMTADDKQVEEVAWMTGVVGMVAENTVRLAKDLGYMAMTADKWAAAYEVRQHMPAGDSLG